MLVASVCFTSLFPVMVVTAAVAAGLWAAKRGQAPGALIHTLHHLELLRIPGVLRPKVQAYSPWPPAGEAPHGID